MAKFRTLTGRVVMLPVDNIDTDQIIPARYLKVTDKAGLAEGLFADWRRDPAFVLNQPAAQGGQILLAGDNFGCGSSREHAPWALTSWGFRAIIAPSFADIFRGNALKNGLLPVVVEPAFQARLMEVLRDQPQLEPTVDLEAQQLRLPSGDVASFVIDPFSRHCLLNGIDQLDYLLSFDREITRYEQDRGSTSCGSGEGR